jgi:hypothetical protein
MVLLGFPVVFPGRGQLGLQLIHVQSGEVHSDFCDFLLAFDTTRLNSYPLASTDDQIPEDEPGQGSSHFIRKGNTAHVEMPAFLLSLAHGPGSEIINGFGFHGLSWGQGETWCEGPF